MRRPVKIAIWTVAGLLGLIVVVIGALLIVANTDSGRSLIVRMTAQLTHGQVQLSGIHGTFPAKLDLDRLELWDKQGLWLWADNLSLRWSPGALLARQVKVNLLHVKRLHVERAPLPSEEQKPASSSSLPKTDLDDLSVEALELGAALAGEPASLRVKGNAHLRSLEDADAHITAERTAGNGEYAVDVHFDAGSMRTLLKLQEPANGPLANLIKVPGMGALSVMARLAGPRSAEQIQLAVDAGPLRARAQGRVDLEHHVADVDYSVNAPAMSPYAGLSWERVESQGRIRGPFTTPTAQVHLLIETLQAPGGAQLRTLEANLGGDRGVLNVDANVNGLRLPGSAPDLLESSPLALHASIRLDDPNRPLTLSATHRLFTLEGNAVTAGEQTAQLKLRLPDLQPFAPLAGTKIHGDAQLQAHATHSTSSSHVDATVDTHLDGGSAAWAGLLRGGRTHLQMAAELTDQQISVEKVQLQAPALTVAANATAARTGAQEVKARFEVGLSNLKRISEALVGTLNLQGTVEGPRDSLRADTRVKTSLSVRDSPRGTVSARLQARGLPKAAQGLLEASGQLDGSPLQVNASFEPVKGGGYHAVIRRAEWKSAHADADMTVGRTMAQAHGAAGLRLGNLSEFNRLLGSALSGSVNGQLSLSTPAARSHAQLEIQAKQVVVGGVSADARLSANGALNALNVSLDADSPAIAGQPAHVDLSALLNLTDKELHLLSLESSYHNQNIRLLHAAQLKFAKGFEVHSFALGAQEASVEVEGQLSPVLDVRAAVRQVKAKLVNAFAPDMLAAGTLDADATIQGSTSAPRGQIHLQALGLKAKNAAAQGLPATDVRAHAELKGESADVETRLTAGSGSQLALTGQAPLTAVGAVNLKLAGNLDLGLLNPILEAGGRHVTGTVAMDTTVTGTAQSPQIAGAIRLGKGSVRDYAQGVSLTDITGVLTGNHGVLRIDELTARAAPGRISVAGTIGVLQPKMPVDLKLTARDAQPIASNIVTANLDAQVQVGGTAREQLDVAGKIHLNRADISIPGGLPPSVAVLDVERAGAPPKPPAAHPLVVNLNLTVDAPRRILVKGRGLDAEMGGQLHIRGTTATPVVEGGFELQRGFFTLANSKLTFTNGTVTFAGTGLQHKLIPSLDFTAQTKAAEVTASVHITGLADAPQIELSSTPELPQDEILARLLFGEPAAQLSALQLVETGAALSSLRGGGGGSSLNPLAKVQKALGLDRLSMGSGSSSTSSSSQQSSGTSVEAGRYVSDRVYVGVKESTTGASQVGVDVDLTKRLKLQARLGNGTATAQGVTPENDPGSSIGMAYQIEY
jgi:translocation and assembly module TamB